MKLVLASNNLKKLRELQALLAPAAVELVNQGALGVSEADEPHITFIENALAKARHAAAATGLAAIADDSGLCVNALGGAPGVGSAVFAPLPSQPGLDREAQRALQDQANNQLLLQRLHGQTQRGAAFVCALVALRNADDPEPLLAFGRWSGQIVTTPEGHGGFGYDPLLYIPNLGATVATLAPALKNQHSHRAIAAQQMLGLMHHAWGL